MQMHKNKWGGNSIPIYSFNKIQHDKVDFGKRDKENRYTNE